MRKFLSRIMAFMGLGEVAAAMEAAPTKEPAVPQRNYQLPVRNWAAALAPTASVEPRTKPVRNRAYRQMRKRLRQNDQIDVRRMNSLLARDEALWRVRGDIRSFHDSVARKHDRCQKPLNEREWRWLQQQAEKENTAGNIARLLLDWNGR